MTHLNYFSIKSDMQVIDFGGFFCEACIVGKEASDQSSNPRYCIDCQKQLAGGNKEATETNQPLVTKAVTKVSEGGTTTLEDVESKEQSFVTPQNLSRTSKLGRPIKELPEDVILQYSADGLGSRQIAIKLSEEMNIAVSHMTIQRILAGQRLLG